MSGSDESAKPDQRVPEAPVANATLAAQVRPAVLGAILLTLITGLVLSGLLLAVSQLVFPHRARGSLLKQNGTAIGSELIAQPFTRPEYFHPRPSAAGSGYDATSSGGTNLGSYNPKLLDGAPGFAGIRQLAEDYRKDNRLAPDAVIPVDAVTRSASGLDPDISPRNAELQLARVAGARGVNEEAVRRVVTTYTRRPQMGFLGSPRVAVLELNLALDKSFPH
jgi:K+-transporting ATPase ATPase C chain